MLPISFDRAAEYYDATRGYLPGVAEQIRDAVLRYTHAGPDARFLELGVGTGRIALPFITAGYSYIGADIARAMMARLQEKVAEAGSVVANRYLLLEADIAQSLPFGAGAFDVILAVHVLHLVERWQAILLEAARTLRKPGGRLLLASDDYPGGVPPKDPAQDPALAVHAKWDEILRSLGVDRPEFRSSRRVDETTLDTFLRESGATIERTDLVEYPMRPISVRELVTHHKERLYSSDWTIPDEAHAEASRRLDRWVKEEHPAPDREISRRAAFHVLAARWER